jgi:hypothetical protein
MQVGNDRLRLVFPFVNHAAYPFNPRHPRLRNFEVLSHLLFLFGAGVGFVGTD